MTLSSELDKELNLRMDSMEEAPPLLLIAWYLKEIRDILASTETTLNNNLANIDMDLRDLPT